MLINGTNIYAGTDTSGVFLSTDNGTNWVQVNNGLTNTHIRSLAASGTNIFAGTAGGVYLSTSDGTSWTQVNNGVGSLGVFCFVVSGTNIFASINAFNGGGGVRLSTNNGTNWTNVSDNIIFSVGALTISGINIFAGSEYWGVWSRPLSELTGVSNEVKVLPQEYSLFQNYPNPFNPSTVVKYAVPFESSVDIRFYNSLGQIVREVNEGNRQPGNYEINFSSSGLASGIYFYSLKAVSTNGKNDFSAVKKMILLK